MDVGRGTKTFVGGARLAHSGRVGSDPLRTGGDELGDGDEGERERETTPNDS